uniref:Uncharacterized protein n=1 Tax=Meloidogyne hapla TaxID=6305 RepID=A0A1I8BL88_MELHA
MNLFLLFLMVFCVINNLCFQLTNGMMGLPSGGGHLQGEGSNKGKEIATSLPMPQSNAIKFSLVELSLLTRIMLYLKSNNIYINNDYEFYQLFTYLGSDYIQKDFKLKKQDFEQSIFEQSIFGTLLKRVMRKLTYKVDPASLSLLRLSSRDWELGDYCANFGTMRKECGNQIFS